jgi:hypothetical protein
MDRQELALEFLRMEAPHGLGIDIVTAFYHADKFLSECHKNKEDGRWVFRFGSGAPSFSDPGDFSRPYEVYGSEKAIDALMAIFRQHGLIP